MQKLIVLLCVCTALLWGGDVVTSQQAEVLRTPRSSATATRLLFPFVTTQPGFDTEITISNTSQDASGNAAQSGDCTLFFYGSGAPPASAPVSIAAGRQFVFTVSQGGPGIAPAQGFQGYVAASCGFPGAKGTARIYAAGRFGFSADAQAIALPRAVQAPQYLLFPFITNQGGLDSHIVLSNTSADPFGSPPMSGSCVLSFHGARAPAANVTAAISPGSVYTTSASEVAPGFEGYVIAGCNFVGATGMGYVTDAAAQDRAFAQTAELLNANRASAPKPLLFTSVTNQNGADTRITIANTTSDPFGTRAASGSCTLSFHGTNAPFPVSTGNIPAGSVYSASTSAVAPGFQGYVIAECPFAASRGWAFTSSPDGTSAGGSETAEVLEIPRSAAPSSLLFTAVTNRDGADTGIAISNTSQDPFGTAQTPGTCAISYFGDVAGNRSTPPPSVSSQIRPGGRLAFSLSQGNPAQGIAAAPGFRGYVIADCTFPMARGVATTTVKTPSTAGKKLSAPLMAGSVITVSSLSLGENRQAQVTVTFSPPPAGDISLTIASSNPMLVRLGTAGALGSDHITTTIPAGTTAVATYAQALAASGSVMITASAGGYTSGAGTVTLSKSGFVLAGPNGIGAGFSTYSGVDTPLTVWAARLDSSNVFVETQQARGGYSVNVPISSSVTGVGTVASSFVAFSGGMDSATVKFSASGSGATTVSLGTPPALPAAGYSLDVTVQQSGLKPFSVTVGKNLQAAASLQLTGRTPSPLVVTVATKDSTRLKFATSLSGTPSDSINLTIPANQLVTPDFYVLGYDSTGSAGYTATAPGYGTIEGTVALAPSGLVIHSPTGYATAPGLGADFTMPPGLVDATIEVWSMRLEPWPELQAVASGMSIPVTVTSSDSAVGTITTSPITITGGSPFASTQFHPIGNGSATIAAASTGYASASVSATVQAPALIVDTGLMIGRYLQQESMLILPLPAPSGGVIVTLQSNSPSLLLSTSPTAAGSPSVALSIPGGGMTATYYLQSLGSSGSATYTASAPGYGPGTGTVDLVPSAVIVVGPSTIQFSGGPVALAVTTAYLSASGVPVAQQSLAGGAPLLVNLGNTNPGTGTVPATVTIAPGTNVVSATFTPVAAGTTSISAQQPAGWTTPSSMAQWNITVQGSPASLSVAKTHSGSFLQGQANVAYTVVVRNAAAAGPTNGLVTVTETVPAGLSLSSMAGTGWTCPAGGTICTRSDTLQPGAAYPAITVTANVAANAPSPQVNMVSVSGGGSAAATATDPATIMTRVTVGTAPVSVTFTVDGVAYSAQQTFEWVAGSSHTLSVNSTIEGTADSRYIFGAWTNGGSASQIVIAPSESATYTAAFNMQYLLKTAVSPAGAGTITPGGWFDAGTIVSISAAANTGYLFAYFSSALGGSANPQDVTMSGPRNVVANFSAQAPQLAAMLSARTGAANARVWTITLANTGVASAVNSQITGVEVAQTGGAACTSAPAITIPAPPPSLANPLPLGLIPVSGSASTAVTLDFSGCAAAARFTVRISYRADGAYSGSTTLNNQFR